MKVGQEYKPGNDLSKAQICQHPELGLAASGTKKNCVPAETMMDVNLSTS